MRFQEVIGHKELKQRLIRMVDAGRTGHSIILTEKDGRGALPMALALIQYLSCREKKAGEDSCGVCPTCKKISALMHPDLHFVFPVNTTSASSGTKPVSGMFIRQWLELVQENPYFTERELYAKIGIEDKSGAINVAEAKELLEKISLKSYEGFNKYWLIWLPEKMNAETANRLLKIVEEPSPDTYFIFISHAPEKIISTIRSRSRVISLDPVPAEEIVSVIQDKAGISAHEAMIYARISGGSLGLSLEMIKGRSSSEAYLPMVSTVLEAAKAKDLYAMLGANDTIVGLSRQQQKEYCYYLEDFLRKIMMEKNGLHDIANILPSEESAVKTFASSFSDSFFEKAFQAIEDGISHLEANVNAKMVFADIGNRLFVF